MSYKSELIEALEIRRDIYAAESKFERMKYMAEGLDAAITIARAIPEQTIDFKESAEKSATISNLIKRLWECISGECYNCSQREEWSCVNKLLKEAVEVIERLSSEMSDSVIVCDACKHNNACLTQAFVEDESRIPFDRNTFFCADGEKR